MKHEQQQYQRAEADTVATQSGKGRASSGSQREQHDAAVPSTMANNRGEGLSETKNNQSTSKTTDQWGLAERFRRFDEVMAKRPPVSAGWPGVLRLPYHQHQVLQYQHHALMRNRILNASVEKIRMAGNERALAEIQQRDQQLMAAIQRFSSQPSSPVSPLLGCFASQQNSPRQQHSQGTASTKPDEDVGECTDHDPPLHSAWYMYYDRRGMAVDKHGNQTHRHVPKHAGMDHYENSLVELSKEIRTVRSFWSHFNNLKAPSSSMINSNYHFFKSGIKPLWEDPANASGGKWTMSFSNDSVRGALMDDMWLNILLALIGETLDPSDSITGVVFSRRARGDRMAIWLRSGVNAEIAFEIGSRIRDIMRESSFVSDNEVSLEFQLHADSMKAGTSYTSKASCSLDLPSLLAVFDNGK